ncbi:hypothetical protein FIBSPDRAFT_1052900 [Athelia psychrophila]|uniref:MYND-type domain-containing protein n=1 Tax=Athelia psychrophila TaxID=1759441 RepID=A0A165WDT2_9AGAM|nr:hypothetical protein FIBSPDRAFT_1052900 [Fibularhizoctonia sp. CBS 109695]
MTVTLGSEIQKFVYPFPIDGTRSKTKIARKSGWIDLIVPLSELGDSGGYSITRFPLLLSRTGSSTAWNMHKLRLDGLPIIDEQIPSLSQEITTHLMLSLSDRERRIHDSGAGSGTQVGAKPARSPVSTSSQQIKDALVEIKGTIMGIFQRFCEGNASRIMGDSPLIVGLQHHTTGIHTVFFFNHIRLDLASNTVVADTVVLPLSKERLNILGKDLTNIMQNRKADIIHTSLPEAVMWKHLLPVMIERCRTWSHKATCEYRRTGQLPLPAELNGISICGCGEGKDLGPFSDISAWKAFAPYATRAALSPLFSVSYMEAVGGLLRDAVTGSNAAKAPGVKETVSTNLCAQCGTGAGGSTTLSLCGVCKAVRYCGRACQAAHWKTHKKDCQRKT